MTIAATHYGLVVGVSAEIVRLCPELEPRPVIGDFKSWMGYNVPDDALQQAVKSALIVLRADLEPREPGFCARALSKFGSRAPRWLVEKRYECRLRA